MDIFGARKRWLETTDESRAYAAHLDNAFIQLECPSCGRWIGARKIRGGWLDCPRDLCGFVWKEEID